MLKAGADAPTALIRGEVTDHYIRGDYITKSEVIAIQCCRWISKAGDLAIETSSAYAIKNNASALRIDLIHRVQSERPDVRITAGRSSLRDDRSRQLAVDELILQVHGEVAIEPIACPHSEVAAPRDVGSRVRCRRIESTSHLECQMADDATGVISPRLVVILTASG